MAWSHVVLDVPATELTVAAEFWGAVTGWPAGDPWPGHPELRSLEPPDGRAYVHLQALTAGAAGVHLDLESADPEATVADALRRGARRVDQQDRWVTLRSPGGLPFCVVLEADDRAPAPVSWPDGHRSRLVQVCVDSPASVHDDEVAFWRGLLGHRWTGSDSPEFAGKWHDDAGSPLQLLFQRLDEDDGPVRAHLDWGTDDLPAEVRRVVALGAGDEGRGHGGWHVLRDPLGLAWCVTENSPEQVRHRHLA